MEEVLLSHHRHSIVVEHRGHIFRRKFVGGIADQQASLAYSSVTNYDASKKEERG